VYEFLKIFFTGCRALACEFY